MQNPSRLIETANLFLASAEQDVEFARLLSHEIQAHRSLMGSSKAYEMAFDIDVELARLALKIARIGYSGKELIPFLNDAAYYASPEEKIILNKEIESIKEKK